MGVHVIFVQPLYVYAKDMKDPSHLYHISEDIHCSVDNIDDYNGCEFRYNAKTI